MLDWQYGLQLAALALCYLAAAKLSLLLAIPPGYATAVWPPSGIALAALLLYGLRLFPAIWLAALIINFGVDSSWLLSAGIATGNTLEAVCGYWLVRRFMGPTVEFRQPESAFRFAAAAAASSVLAAAVGVLVLYLANRLPAGEALSNWYTWWQGDVAAIIVITPFALAWLRGGRPDAGTASRRTEIAAFAAALLATFAVVFALAESRPDVSRTLTFLLIPFMAWAGCRFSERVVTAAIVCVTAMAVWATLDQRGPFLLASTGEALLVLQAFIGTVALMGLVLCALTRERADAAVQLQQASERLEATVAERTVELEQKNRELAADLAERGRLTAALQRREAQLAEAQAITHIGSWNWDIGSDRVTWSDELFRIFGLAPGQFAGTVNDYLSHVHPEDRERIREAIRSAVVVRQPWEFIERIVRPDGAVRVLKTIGGVWTDEAGEVSALYGACLDITEATRREKVQEVQHTITKVLVQTPSWPDAITRSMRIVCEMLGWRVGQMWTVDADSGLIRFRHAWSMPGEDYSAFIEASRNMAFEPGRGLPGRTWLAAAPEWIEDAPSDPARTRARWAEQAGLRGALCFPLIAGGRVLGVLEFFGSERLRPQEELLQAAVALGSQLGEYIVRNRAESLLRESEERFRLLIEGVKEYAIVMLDPKGRIATWNTGAARITGYASDDILGQHFSRFYVAEDRPLKKPETLLAAAVEHGAVEDEGWRLRKDGSRFWANVVITVLYGPDGQLRGFAKVTRDMTERKQVEALEEAGRQTRQFLAMLGHELRNPLAPIRNAVGVMRMREIADPQIKYCRDLIERQVTHLARLVDDLLDASRITTGMIGLQTERIDLADVIARAVEASRPGMEQRGHALTIEASREPIAVSGDPTRLVQVVQNLLNNAAKYTPRGGNVRLRVRREGEMAAVEVRDDGIGIAPELLPRIFDLFMQGDGGLARTEGGLGVGLTLARRIAEMHGGSIQAASEGIGRGATFVVRLPVLESVQPSAADVQASAAHSQPVSPLSRRVLVVDDNHDAADSVAALLSLRGHEVFIAYDGIAALVLAAQRRPEVVLLDIGLPGMDGYEVAQRLRGSEASRDSLIVALTGYGQAEDRRRSEAASFDAHLVKPVDFETLYTLIDERTKRYA